MVSGSVQRFTLTVLWNPYADVPQVWHQLEQSHLQRAAVHRGNHKVHLRAWAGPESRASTGYRETNDHSCITEAVADLRPLFYVLCRKIVLPLYFINRGHLLSFAKSTYSFIIIDNRKILCYYTHVIDICAVHRNADRMVCAWGFSHCTRWSGLYLSAGSMVFARKG